MHWLTIIGIVITALGTLSLTVCSMKKMTTSKNIFMLVIGIVMIVIGPALTVQENIELTREITRLNKKIVASITGGDSYCYFLPTRPSKQSNIVDLMLLHKGEYTLYDVSVKIDDVEKLLNIVKKGHEGGKLPYDSMTGSMQMLARASTVIPVGNFGPNQVMQMTGIQVPPDVDKKSYNIYITARNGSVMQILRFHRIDGQWKRAIKVIRDGETVEEVIDADYPRNKDGEIDW